jgi:hypothetical protein
VMPIGLRCLTDYHANRTMAPSSHALQLNAPGAPREEASSNYCQ